MQHNINQLLFAYWDQLRGQRHAPKRTEIDPACISTILPHTLMLECCDQPDHYRFRIAGTQLCEYFGMELRGHDFLSLWQPDDRKILQQKIHAITTYSDIATLDVQSLTNSGEIVCSEVLILPLSSSQGTIYRLLGTWSLLDQIVWRDDARLIKHSLVTSPQNNQLIMQTCHSLKTSKAAAGAHSYVNEKHHVASSRRRFRIYNGGRS